ncbi:hypothetical protein D9M72_480280 [compost metagenome]
MHRVEEGLAPVDVVLAGLDAEHRLLAHFGAVEHEGIEDFPGRTGVVTLGVVAQVRTAIADVVVGDTGQARVVGDQARACIIAVDERVGVGTGVLIGFVVPTGGADTKAHFLFINNIHLGQQVDTVGDVGPGLTEVVITIVVVRRAEHALVGAFGAYAVVVLDGVVQAHRPIRATGIELERVAGDRHDCNDNSYGQRTATQDEGLTVFHMAGSISYYCWGYLERRNPALGLTDRN